MIQLLFKRSSLAAGALSLIVTTLFSNKCSGNPVQIEYPPPPSPSNTVEIAGMAAYYEGGKSDRFLGIVVNEYEYDESSSIIGSSRVGSARTGTTGGRRIVRQSVCYDSNVPVDESFNVVAPKVRIIGEFLLNFVLCSVLFPFSFSSNRLREVKLVLHMTKMDGDLVTMMSANCKFFRFAKNGPETESWRRDSSQ